MPARKIKRRTAPVIDMAVAAPLGSSTTGRGAIICRSYPTELAKCRWHVENIPGRFIMIETRIAADNAAKRAELDSLNRLTNVVDWANLNGWRFFGNGTVSKP